MSATTPSDLIWSQQPLPSKADKEELKKAIAVDDKETIMDFTRHFGQQVLQTVTFESDVTPLMYAAKKDSTDCMRYMITQGVDVHAVDLYSRDAAYHAASHDSPDAIYVLKAAGADLDKFNEGNPINPILAAAYNSSEHVFKALLNCGANIDVRTNDATSLTLADLVRASEGGRLIPIFDEYKLVVDMKLHNEHVKRATEASTQGLKAKTVIRKLKPRAP